MPVTVVVGGQYGSEGKGKVAHYLARQSNAEFAVRCGGSNSGHTVIDPDGRVLTFQHLPTAAILPDVKLALCAGSYIDVDILLREVEEAEISPGRLIIDPDAVVITDEMKRREGSGGLVGKIGSTGSGTGAAVAARVNREDSVVFAKDDVRLSKYIAEITELLRLALDQEKRIILEGTQGFGLSPLHSRLFPKVTSRDTTAATFVSEVGLSPFDVDDVVMVLRAFPIRVAGNSGPLPNEISWEELTEEGNHSSPLIEMTSVTKKVRRVGRFCPEIVKRAIQVNAPSTIVLNHVDYLAADPQKQQPVITDFIRNVEYSIGSKINFVGLGRSEIRKNGESLFEAEENA